MKWVFTDEEMESQGMKWLAEGHGSVALFTYRLQQVEQRYPHVAGINSHHPHFTNEKAWGSEEGCNDQNLFWTGAGLVVHECVSLSQSRDQLPWLRCWPASCSEWTQLSNRGPQPIVPVHDLLGTRPHSTEWWAIEQSFIFIYSCSPALALPPELCFLSQKWQH